MAKHFVICILLCSTLLNCSSQNIESENNLGELAIDTESDKFIQFDTTTKIEAFINDSLFIGMDGFMINSN